MFNEIWSAHGYNTGADQIPLKKDKLIMQEESMLAAIQRQQIEIAVGELLLTSDHYIRTSITERIRHLIAHADHTLDITRFSDMAKEELEELNILPPSS